MKIICPSCQTDFPLEAGINDVDARAAVQRAFSLTPIGKVLLGYVQLFKPEQRALSMGKVVKILDQIIPMVQAGKIEYNGRTWAAPQPYWQSAIEQMLDTRETLRLPLKNHNYLFTIISGYADKAEGKAEARKQGGITRREPEERKGKGMPEDVRSKLNQFLNKSIS